MNKGLSVNQQTILLLGYENHLCLWKPDLFYGEILEHVFGLKPDFKNPDGSRRGKLKFTKNVERKNMKSIRSSASRTLRRLKKKGLIELDGIRIFLTPKGIDCAQRLKEKKTEEKEL